jgi:hypothetical protein
LQIADKRPHQDIYDMELAFGDVGVARGLHAAKELLWHINF